MLGGPGHGLLFVCTGPDTDEDAALLLVFLRDLFNENLLLGREKVGLRSDDKRLPMTVALSYMP